MNRLKSRQLLFVAKATIVPRQFSALAHNRASSAPLIEHYRSAWPDVLKDKPSAEMPELPKRTVPDEKLRFSFAASFDAGGAFFYPHLKTNPADFKVRMKVFLEDIPLKGGEKDIFVQMVGKRLRVGNGELLLTTDKFPNKMENRKYLVFLLENLIAESKKFYATHPESVIAKSKIELLELAVRQRKIAYQQKILLAEQKKKERRDAHQENLEAAQKRREERKKEFEVFQKERDENRKKWPQGRKWLVTELVKWRKDQPPKA